MCLNICLSFHCTDYQTMSQKCSRNRLMSLLVCIISQMKFSPFRALASEMSTSTLLFSRTLLGFQSTYKGKLGLICHPSAKPTTKMTP